MKTKLKGGDERIFVKSGSRVTLVTPSLPYLGKKTWVVRRVDTGKEMIVPEDSLAPVVKREED